MPFFVLLVVPVCLHAFLANNVSRLLNNWNFTVNNSAHFESTIALEKIQENVIMTVLRRRSELLFTKVPFEGAVQAVLRKPVTTVQITDLLNFVF